MVGGVISENAENRGEAAESRDVVKGRVFGRKGHMSVPGKSWRRQRTGRVSINRGLMLLLSSFLVCC